MKLTPKQKEKLKKLERALREASVLERKTERAMDRATDAFYGAEDAAETANQRLAEFEDKLGLGDI
jgi:hypothetical protein